MTATLVARAKRTIHHVDVESLHAVADDHEPSFGQVVLEGLEAARAAVDVDELEQNLAVLDIEDVVDWEGLFSLPERMTKVSGDDAAAELLSVMVEASNATGIAQAAFTLVNPRAVEWAEQHAAELVLGLRNDSRDAVRQVIVRALNGGATAQQAARMVRSAIGLSPAHANALVAFEQALRDQLAGGRPVRPGTLVPRIPKALREGDVQRLVDAYSRRLLAHRAETIARTEVMRAAHRGMLLNWQDAADAGMFDQSTALRRWVVTADDRLCDRCRPMQGQTIGFTEDFESTQVGTGRRARAVTPTTTLTPPLHPRCRCTMVLITDGPLVAPAPIASVDDIVAKHPGVTLDIYERDDLVTLSRIVVPEHARGQGIGQAVLDDLLEYADREQKTVALTPSADYGGTKSKLVSWYRRLGFRPNKGRSRDFRTTEAMVRDPA